MPKLLLISLVVALGVLMVGCKSDDASDSTKEFVKSGAPPANLRQPVAKGAGGGGGAAPAQGSFAPPGPPK